MKTLLKNSIFLILFSMCAGIAGAQSLSGKVLYQNDPSKPINRVTVVLTNVDEHTSSSFTTGNDGAYLFDNVTPGNYTLSAYSSRESGAATMADAEMVKQYLEGSLELSPLQLMAADVNGSGNVTNGDYQLIKNYVLKNHPFPAGEWQFQTVSFVYGGRIAEGVPTGIGGMCSGDVGGVFIPIGRANIASPIELSGEQLLQPSSKFTTGIATATDLEISAAGLIINYPGELMHIQSVEFAGTGFEYVITDNQVRLIWDSKDNTTLHIAAGSQIVKLVAETSENFSEASKASLSLAGNSCLVNAAGKSASLQLSAPLLKAGKTSFAISAYPNPCKSSASITINSPVEGNATIELFSTNGKLIRQIPAGYVHSGSQEVKVGMQNLAAGKYVCRIKVSGDENVMTKTLQLLKVE